MTPSVSRQLQAALDLRSAGMLSEAFDMLTTPGEYDAHLSIARAEIEFALGRFQDAALSYFSVTIAEPNNPDAYFNLALCLERGGRWDVAAEAFQHVLRLDPGWADARLGLGACLLHLGRAEEALMNFNQCDPDFELGPALTGKAAALQLLRRFDDAERAYELLLASDPNSEEGLANLIAMGIETHDQERVWDYSRRLLDICPHSMVALQGLATVALESRDHEAAVSYCNRILKSAPDCLEAWHNLRIAMNHFPFSPTEPILALHTGRKQ